MILRATFENIYSIKDETQISFVAGKSNALRLTFPVQRSVTIFLC